MKSSEKRFLLALFAGALALRVLYVLSVKDAYFFEHLQTEPKHYDEWASLIRKDDAPMAPFEQAPGFAYFLSCVQDLTTRGAFGNAIVQSFLGAATCVLLARVARLWFGFRAAVATGVLAAVYGPFLYYGGAVLPETLFVFLCAMALWASVERTVTQTLTLVVEGEPRWALAGAFWATAFLVRSNVAFAFPFVAWDAWKTGKRPALVRLVAPIAVVWAWLVFANHSHGGHFVLTIASGGENFWLGNNPLADGVNPFPTGALGAAAETASVGANDVVEFNQRLGQLGFDFLRHHPLDAALLAAKKAAFTFHDAELPNAGSPAWETSHSWLFRVPGLPLSFGPLLVMALLGVCLGWKRMERKTLVAAFPAMAVLTGIVFFTNGRFRLVMVPALLLSAGLAWDCACEAYANEQWPNLRLAVPAVAAGLLLAFHHPSRMYHYEVPEISVNIGILERNAGNFESAVHHLQTGVNANPHDSIGRAQLVLALGQTGASQEAVKVLGEGLRLDPGDEMLRQLAVRMSPTSGGN